MRDDGECLRDILEAVERIERFGANWRSHLEQTTAPPRRRRGVRSRPLLGEMTGCRTPTFHQLTLRHFLI